VIYGVHVGKDAFPFLGDAVGASGGRVLTPRSAEDLPAAFAEILQEFRSGTCCAIRHRVSRIPDGTGCACGSRAVRAPHLPRRVPRAVKRVARRRIACVTCVAGVLALATAAAPAPPDARALMGKYLDLVTRYRDGDTEAAIKTIAAWDQKDLGRVAFALTASAKAAGSRFTNDVVARLPAAIMLHTEAGLYLDWQGGRDPWPQWQIARWVADIEPRSDAHREFLRAWYLAFGLHCLATYRVADALVDLERAHVRFPDDVEIALALAQAYEARGTASMRPALVAPPDSDAGRDLRTAAALFTEVLRQQPALGRARVRLGRVTSLLGEEEAALTELARAATQGDERVAYLSHLFAGEIPAPAFAPARRSRGVRKSPRRAAARPGGRAGPGRDAACPGRLRARRAGAVSRHRGAGPGRPRTHVLGRRPRGRQGAPRSAETVDRPMTDSGLTRRPPGAQPRGGVSHVPEQRREQQDHERSPGRIHREVRGLPCLEGAERFAAAQESA
jgi:tetratricopeptide (TPR) repeat protein